jgi:hypothetical protein
MNGGLRRLRGKADSIPENVLLWINAGMACFVALAHGGALAITYAKPTSNAEDIRELALFSLPLAAVVIVTAAIALFRLRIRRQVLGIHGFIVAGSAAALLLWAFGILLKGIPEGNFSWSVGLLTAWVGYSVFVLCRFSLPLRLRTHTAILYAPLMALVVAAVVDVGVLVRLSH